MRAWQRGLRRPLRTTDGRALSVVYRGRCPGGAGPDVRAALLAFDNGHLVEGDVEFHLRTSDWRVHRHDRDPRYRSVILHVVLDPDGSPPPDARGDPLPTLALCQDDLKGLVDDPGEQPGSPSACHREARERGAERIVGALDALGDRRLAEKAARLEAELTRSAPEAVAYAAIADALGFSHNREPFARLARAVPIELLGALLGRRAPSDALLLAEAILFGVAGLLPSQRSGRSGNGDVRAGKGAESAREKDLQRPGRSVNGDILLGTEPETNDPRAVARSKRPGTIPRRPSEVDPGEDPAGSAADELVDELEAVWALHRADWDGFGLTFADWTFGGARAANYPTRRVAAAARLVVRYRFEGLDAALLAPLRDRAGLVRLESAVSLEASDDYWATHADFGVPLPGPPAALLGQERARDAVANVILPFALAVAARTGDRALSDTAWEAYRSFSRPATYGVTRALAGELGLAAKQLATARRQQGLLYLSRNHCERAACERCPLASDSAGQGPG